MDKQSVLNKLILLKDTLPKRQKILCDYIIEHFQELSVLSIAELAERVGVGPTTVMRFIKNVGYESYSDFKKQFHYYTLESSKPTWWHLEKSVTNVESIEGGSLEKTWKEINNLMDNSIDQQLVSEFQAAINLILNSATVNIVGFRTSKALAYYFEYMLSEIYPKVRQLSNDTDFIYDRLVDVGNDHCILMFALSPYSTNTIKVAEHCYKENIPIILITDHLSCPISGYSRHILKVKSSENQYSIVPVVALIEAMVIEIGQRTSEYSIKRLSQINKILTDKSITTT